MPSPFPGMDPYLERYWFGVHLSLLVYTSGHLNQSLPEDLVARIDGTDWLDESCDSHVERSIAIFDTTSGGRAVTAIEFLSPNNKTPGSERDSYRRKQRRYLAGGVNLVEVDLVRAGDFVLAVPEQESARGWRTPYTVCVRRATRPDEAEVYPVPLRDRLPVIAVPLRPGDGDAALDLQSLIDQVYLSGSYSRIDYTHDPEPPFGPVDARWVDELLQAAGRRPRPNGAESSEGS